MKSSAQHVSHITLKNDELYVDSDGQAFVVSASVDDDGNVKEKLVRNERLNRIKK